MKLLSVREWWIKMVTPRDITYLPDLAKLLKSVLEDIANELGIPGNNAVELANEIFKRCKDNDSWKLIYNIAKNYLFAGKTSYAWYPIKKVNHDVSLFSVLTEKLGFNPFYEINPQCVDLEEDLEEANITSTPEIIAGTVLPESRNRILRLIYKSETRLRVSGLRTVEDRITSLVTVVIDKDERYIEIRGNDKTIKKVEEYMGKIFYGTIEPLERQNIIAPFGNEIERFADVLEGHLVETVSIPEEILSELSDEQLKAIANILIAIDEYFATGDFLELENVLKNSIACFDDEGENYLSVPFTAIVLAGINRLGMAAENELRSQPLYRVIQPYLQHQGGFIKFPLEENGNLNYYTIKVGLRTNTVYFVTPATEAAIDFVRKKILGNF